MEEEWSPVWEFPEYWISNRGLIRHNVRNHFLTCLVNNTGSHYVSLWRHGKVYNRSLPKLVAQAFLDTPKHESFDTTINLNGNRRDNRADNLAWRPTWFARRYHRQFNNNERGYKCPVVLLDTGERFDTSWEAAVKYGLIDRDILVATVNGEPVWPHDFTFQALIRTPYRTL